MRASSVHRGRLALAPSAAAETPDADIRRRYVTRLVHQRLHQQAFRESINSWVTTMTGCGSCAETYLPTANAEGHRLAAAASRFKCRFDSRLDRQRYPTESTASYV
jgi:hypothetical protein